MKQIRTYNKIDPLGLNRFPEEKYKVSSEVSDPDAIILRSHDLKDYEFNPSLIAIGRAGAGVNNINVEACSDRGIVVFNTPGANANAVKEIVLAAMFSVSRNLSESTQYLLEMADIETGFEEKVEKIKARFVGSELKGKRLGIIGLGAIGTMVADAAISLGMEVDGYDPFISVERAWGLSRSVRKIDELGVMLKNADFISLHMPLSDQTRGFFNEKLIRQLKSTAVVLNFSRGGIVDEVAMLAGLDQGKIYRYITDFPVASSLRHPGVNSYPHLGASTAEAEQNCAVMIADQMMGFLEYGNITNSVNFPTCVLDKNVGTRLIIVNRNVPNMVGQITSILAAEKLNIVEMLNKSRDDLAYNIVDFTGEYPGDLCDKIKSVTGVISARLIS